VIYSLNLARISENNTKVFLLYRVVLMPCVTITLASLTLASISLYLHSTANFGFVDNLAPYFKYYSQMKQKDIIFIGVQQRQRGSYFVLREIIIAVCEKRNDCRYPRDDHKWTLPEKEFIKVPLGIQDVSIVHHPW
jgi:hypothetical protein